MQIEQLDPIVLNEDLPVHGLKRGDIGAVVEIYSPGEIEGEFVTASGRTQALVSLHIGQVRPVGPQDIPAVRSLDAALLIRSSFHRPDLSEVERLTMNGLFS